MIQNIKMLVIDDDPGIIEVLGVLFDLNKKDLPAYGLYSNVDDFRKAITPNVQICIVDYKIPLVNTLSMIKEVHNTNPNCWFIMFSGQKDCNVIVEFMNESYGSRYVEKATPDCIEKLMFFIREIVKKITVIESYFHESFNNNLKLSQATKILTNLKNEL